MVYTYTYIHTYIYIHIYAHIYIMGYYLAIKKKEILPFAATWMDLESVIQSEVSQKEKNKYCMLTQMYEI